MTAAAGASAALADAVLAARLCALDFGLGGLTLRGDGTARDQVLAELDRALPAAAPRRRLPGHIDADRLAGGIDLAAALAGQGLRTTPGLLAEAAGGLIVAPMAERLDPAVAARVAHAIDAGGPDRFLTALLDDGIGDDERPPAALTERLAFHIDLASPAPPGDAPAATPIGEDAAIAALVEIADALGVAGARAPLLALRAARAAARLVDRAELTEADLRLAARLVLAPRATRLPPAAEAETAEPPPPSGDPREAEGEGSGDALADTVLDAARALLPPDLLAGADAPRAGRGPGTRSRGSGQRRRSPTRGRPAGTRPGMPGGGARLSLIETLRSAAPWQALRRADAADRRVRIRRDDLRIRRFVARAEPVTIFAVDASGSAALARLAEAKGAVELLLAEAYVSRAQVALVAFRGQAADLLLPPTRSLARARRALAELPGGGGTPLAAGLDMARGLALAERARGRTPFIVLLTDGRANVARSGTGGRPEAEAEALAAAQAIRGDGLDGLFIDTAPRARPETAALAVAMGFRHLAMPHADAQRMAGAVGAMRPAPR
ncbi:magnesium chelatase subunit D [Sphingomonas sp. 1P06PA]|uniref:magnesium chelatase subunit D n=1 Tax=Sphingomonas sp. 1P06PA TaxID=554121 RepID=UPI0039A65668